MRFRADDVVVRRRGYSDHFVMSVVNQSINQSIIMILTERSKQHEMKIKTSENMLIEGKCVTQHVKRNKIQSFYSMNLGTAFAE